MGCWAMLANLTEGTGTQRNGRILLQICAPDFQDGHWQKLTRQEERYEKKKSNEQGEAPVFRRAVVMRQK